MVFSTRQGGSDGCETCFPLALGTQFGETKQPKQHQDTSFGHGFVSFLVAKSGGKRPMLGWIYGERYIYMCIIDSRSTSEAQNLPQRTFAPTCSMTKNMCIIYVYIYICNYG